MIPTFSIIIPTIGRDSLARTLASIAPQLHSGDEMMVLRDSSGDWGATARNSAMPRASGSHLLFMDDDDVYLPGGLDLIRHGVSKEPEKVHLFRQLLGPSREVIWKDRRLIRDNVGTQGICVPNGRLGRWSSRYQCDFDFLESTLALYPLPSPIVWHEEVVAVWRPT